MLGKMECYGLTDIGKVREVNEDQFLIADLNKSMLIHQTSLSHDDHTRLFGGSQGKLLLVADGMGGHAAGKQASTLAVQTLSRYLLNTMPWLFRLHDNEADLEEEFRASLAACQRRLEAQGEAVPEQRGMGTTLTMAYVLWPRLYVVHVGDSRCYLVRQRSLDQITNDQTMAQALVDRGQLRPEHARASRLGHLLWSCLGGTSAEFAPEVYKATLMLGDTLLLCTDGLTARVTDERLLDLLEQAPTAEEACRSLVQAANEAGGADNITVVVARFRDAEAPTAALEEHAAATTTLELPSAEEEALVEASGCSEGEIQETASHGHLGHADGRQERTARMAVPRRSIPRPARSPSGRCPWPTGKEGKAPPAGPTLPAADMRSRRSRSRFAASPC